MKRVFFTILIVFIYSGCASNSEKYKPLYLAKPEIESLKEK